MSEKYLFKEIKETCEEIIKNEVYNLLKDKTFVLSDCDFFIKKLTDNIAEQIKNCSNNFKYIINVIFLDNTQKGFSQNIGPIYDPETDGIISVLYPFNQINCVVNLFVLSL